MVTRGLPSTLKRTCPHRHAPCRIWLWADISYSSIVRALDRNGDQISRCGTGYTGTVPERGACMSPVGKALWFIESHFADEITLGDIADAAGVSRYHMLRAFGATTGRSVMRYVRGRRLTEAARSLASKAPDILTVALAAGYGSHEAFTRAFRDQFGLTPEAVRTRRSLVNLAIVEAIRMPDQMTSLRAPDRFVRSGPMLFAGLRKYFRFEDRGGIPMLWHAFGGYQE